LKEDAYGRNQTGFTGDSGDTGNKEPLPVPEARGILSHNPFLMSCGPLQIGIAGATRDFLFGEADAD